MRTILFLLLTLSLSDISLGQAVYRGRTYNAPVCNSPNCQMCNTIRSQLYTPPIVQKPNPLYLSEVGGPPPIRSKEPPVTRSLDKVTELVPTPIEAVPHVLTLLNLSPSDIFIEPGCGDGRILRRSKAYLSIGIELNPESATQARLNAPNSIVLNGDALIYDYSKVTAVSMYLYPSLMEKIIDLLPKGTRIVSYLHTCNGIDWREHVFDNHKFYTGVK